MRSLKNTSMPIPSYIIAAFKKSLFTRATCILLLIRFYSLSSGQYCEKPPLGAVKKSEER